MPKIVKWLGLGGVFLFSLVLFTYWTFPYGILKERIVTAIEQQIGPGYDVRIESLSPSFFTGAVLKGVKVVKYEGETSSTVWEAVRVKIRASLSGLLFNKPSFTFSVKSAKGELSGSYGSSDDGYSLDMEMSDFNIGDFGFLTGGSTAKLVSQMNGELSLNINKRQMIQSSGKADIALDNIVLKEGELKLGESGSFALPEIVFSKGSGSSFKFELQKGAVKVQSLKLTGGDINIDLNGELFMSSALKNYRMNLKGIFSVSEKLERAVPVLFMIEKQRQPDGTYPVTITGRIEKPSIKIGDFTLPL